MRFKNLTGMKFGKLTVLGLAEKRGKHFYWHCKCDCGNYCSVEGSHLLDGHSKSCGCMKHQGFRFTHGLSHTKLYRCWRSIMNRCFNTNDKEFSRYGGRGITIFPEWINDFQAFYDYVSKLPHFGEKGYSLDRINNDGNYEPDNIRWATAKQQACNTRRNTLVNYNGDLITAKEAAEKSGINYGTLITRIQHGDTGDYLFRPVKK